MKLAIHPEADLDVAEAIAFYEEQTIGLGDDFLGEVLRTFEHIESAPKAWPLVEGPVRRCLVKRSPYAVFYSADSGMVLAVTNTRRRPGGWKGRL